MRFTDTMCDAVYVMICCIFEFFIFGMYVADFYLCSVDLMQCCIRHMHMHDLYSLTCSTVIMQHACAYCTRCDEAPPRMCIE